MPTKPKRYLLLSANPPTSKTGCGKRTLATANFLRQLGCEVTFWCPLANTNSDDIIEAQAFGRIVTNHTDLNPAYDVAWSMNNWTRKSIKWAIDAHIFCRQQLSTKVAVDATGDLLRAGKAYWKEIDASAYADYVKLERLLWARLDVLLMVSEGLKQRVKALKPKCALGVLPLAQVPLKYLPSYSASSRAASIGMPGTMHDPNVAHFKWFLKNVWPHIYKRDKDLSLSIFGRGSEALTPLCRSIDGAEAKGTVDSFRNELAKHRLIVVPADAPGGVKTVVIEALAAGTPIITVPNVLDNLGISPGPALLTAESTSQFVERILGLFKSGQRGNVELHMNAELALYRYKNDFDTCMHTNLAYIEQLLKER